jgi:hypothetical protein
MAAGLIACLVSGLGSCFSKHPRLCWFSAHSRTLGVELGHFASVFTGLYDEKDNRARSERRRPYVAGQLAVCFSAGS